MRTVLFKALPDCKEDVTLALESGVDGLIVPSEHVAAVSSLARVTVLAAEDVTSVRLNAKSDEDAAAEAMDAGRTVVLEHGWEIIPVENLLARVPGASLALEAETLDEARLAAGILERGVDTVVVPPSGLTALKDIVAALKYQADTMPLTEAVITEITPVGMGHRVCVDTLSVFRAGQGMLAGNSAAFTFLVNAETEHNEYVASRPFRINAGAVHAYAVLPGDRTCYLEELAAGSEVLIVDHKGATQVATVGRVKVEKRPMLLIRAKAGDTEGTVFLQNAETIRVVTPNGTPVSVVELKPGDRVLCRLDVAGRHFGMRISEDIKEG